MLLKLKTLLGRSIGAAWTNKNFGAFRSVTDSRRLGLVRTLILAMAPVLLVACGGGSSDPGTLKLTPAFNGRQFDRPIEVGAYTGGRVFVAEQPGVITVQKPDGSGAVILLDLRAHVDIEKGEGLLSFVLDPDFENNGHVWAYYFAEGVSQSVLARYDVVDGAAEQSSELVILRLDQPGFNQNGGAIRFGIDGMLYLSLGDGSASLDPFENGQDLGTLLGSVIRIDVRTSTAEEPYLVPGDNPFVDVSGAQSEIWAYGFRSLWRIAFDPQTGTLWGADVGASDFEEINLIERGSNYGWNVMEGYECRGGRDQCDKEEFSPPAHAYAQEAGRCAAIGGIVYRGNSLPGLEGYYLYADFCTGEVWALNVDDPTTPVLIAEGAGSVTSFGSDSQGSVYIANYEGAIWRLQRP